MKGNLRIGALISGGGTNLQAIIDGCLEGAIDGRIVFVGSDNPDASGLERAQRHGLDTFVVDYRAQIAAYRDDPERCVLPADFDFEDIAARQTLLKPSTDRQHIRAFLESRALAEGELLKHMADYPFDLLVLVFFGILGYTAKKLNFDVTPMVMGYILGPVIEYSFGQTVNLARGDTLHYIFVARPVTATILAITPFVTAWLWWRGVRLRRKHVKAPPVKEQPAEG